MKVHNNTIHHKVMIGILVLACIGLQITVVAQSNKDKPRIQLDYFSFNNTELKLIATVKTKEERSYVNVPGIPVRFYMDSISEESILGIDTSDADGRSILSLRAKELEGRQSYYFIAAILEHERFADYDRDLEILPAQMEVGFEEEEDQKMIDVHLAARDSAGMEVPVGGIDVKVYVQRLFGELPISTEFNTTNQSGDIGITFPDDIPGDKSGMIDIIVKVTDHDLYGNLVYKESLSWGMPLQVEQERMRKELWSARSNAPWYLIIIVNAMLLAIWGTILYIILLLIRIRKSGRIEESMQTPSTGI